MEGGGSASGGGSPLLGLPEALVHQIVGRVRLPRDLGALRLACRGTRAAVDASGVAHLKARRLGDATRGRTPLAAPCPAARRRCLRCLAAP